MGEFDDFDKPIAAAPKGGGDFAEFDTSRTSVPEVPPAGSSLDEPESVVGRNLRQFLGVDPRARFSFANVLHPDLGVAADAAKNVVTNAPAGAADMVKGAAGSAVRFATQNPMNAVRHPGAALREGVRSVNDLVPGASTLAETVGGPKAVYDPEDAAAVPGVRDILPTLALAEGGLRAGSGAVDALARRAAEAPAREAASTFRDLGKSAVGNGKARLEQIGPEELARVNDEFGITKAPDPRAAVQAAKAQVGAARDAAYDVVQKAGGDVDLGTVAKGLDELQTKFRSKAATRPFAEDVANLRTDLLTNYGEEGRISAAKLQEEISAVNDGAYGANYANPKAAQVVQRRTAGALREVLDSHLDDVAKKGPEARDAVDAIEDANAKFAVLKTIEPIVKKQAVAKAFAPPPEGLIARAQDVAHTIQHPTTLIPKAAEVASNGLDAVGRGAAAVRRAIPYGPDAVLNPLIVRALHGDAAAAARVAELSRNPIIAARVNALRRQAEVQP